MYLANISFPSLNFFPILFAHWSIWTLVSFVKSFGLNFTFPSAFWFCCILMFILTFLFWHFGMIYSPARSLYGVMLIHQSLIQVGYSKSSTKPTLHIGAIWQYWLCQWCTSTCAQYEMSAHVLHLLWMTGNSLKYSRQIGKAPVQKSEWIWNRINNLAREDASLNVLICHLAGIFLVGYVPFSDTYL